MALQNSTVKHVLFCCVRAGIASQGNRAARHTSTTSHSRREHMTPPLLLLIVTKKCLIFFEIRLLQNFNSDHTSLTLYLQYSAHRYSTREKRNTLAVTNLRGIAALLLILLYSSCQFQLWRPLYILMAQCTSIYRQVYSIGQLYQGCQNEIFSRQALHLHLFVLYRVNNEH